MRQRKNMQVQHCGQRLLPAPAGSVVVLSLLKLGVQTSPHPDHGSHPCRHRRGPQHHQNGTLCGRGRGRKYRQGSNNLPCPPHVMGHVPQPRRGHLAKIFQGHNIPGHRHGGKGGNIRTANYLVPRPHGRGPGGDLGEHHPTSPSTSKRHPCEGVQQSYQEVFLRAPHRRICCTANQHPIRLSKLASAQNARFEAQGKGWKIIHNADEEPVVPPGPVWGLQ